MWKETSLDLKVEKRVIITFLPLHKMKKVKHKTKKN